MRPVIRFENVTKQFGSQKALDRLSLEVPAGSVFALLGENGAGKTTTIRTLLGLTTPDQGQATVLGLDSARQGHQVRSRVGYVAERPTLYDWMTVREIGWFTSGFYPDGFYNQYLKLAEHYQLPLARKIKHLSKGMRAKVALSLALAHEPELLILDEPTSGSIRWCGVSSSKAWSTSRPRGVPCCCRATRSAKSSASPIGSLSCTPAGSCSSIGSMRSRTKFAS
jgi:ABC-2 type transport system ATP-binding protein